MAKAKAKTPAPTKAAPRKKRAAEKVEVRELPPNTWGSYAVDENKQLYRAELWVPAFVRKNERYRAFGRGRYARIILSATARKFQKLVSDAVFFLWDGPKATDGTWRLRVVTVWPKLRHVGPDVPGGDSDASLSAIKDALQTAGFIDDDVRIVSDETLNLYRKGARGLYVVLERVAYDVAEAHLHPVFGRVPLEVIDHASDHADTEE